MIYNTEIIGLSTYNYWHKLINLGMCHLLKMYVQKHLGEFCQYKSSTASSIKTHLYVQMWKRINLYVQIWKRITHHSVSRRFWCISDRHRCFRLSQHSSKDSYRCEWYMNNDHYNFHPQLYQQPTQRNSRLTVWQVYSGLSFHCWLK